MLNNNTIIINTIYIKQWVNITSNIFCQIVTNRNKVVIELIPTDILSSKVFNCFSTVN